jgi:hypothetical protein
MRLTLLGLVVPAGTDRTGLVAVGAWALAGQRERKR